VPPRLLIAEDDARLRDVLVRALRAEGFDADAVANGRDLLERAVDARAPDALIVDVGLPDADGRDVCHALRGQGVWTPVLFLTARDGLVNRLAGFRAGGDDYVTKAFDIEEVAERLQALLRCGGPRDPAPAPDGELRLDPSEHAIVCGGQRATLTPTEFRALAALATRRTRRAQPACGHARRVARPSCRRAAPRAALLGRDLAPPTPSATRGAARARRASGRRRVR
jgi:two-component system OmpR family response regulator